MSAAVCTIGDEILIGQITDTNSAAISRELGAAGVRVTSMVSIGDRREEILKTLTEELKINDIVITTGGLGPTRDDITRNVLAELSGSSRFIRHEGQLQVVRKLLRARGLDTLEPNLRQADVPENSEVIVNRFGTAPIMVFRLDEARFAHPCTLIAMPGVPFETVNALPDVIADIKAHHRLQSITHRNVMTFGIAESVLAQRIGAWEDSLPRDMKLAYLPDTLTGVKLRLSVYGGEAADNERRLQEQIQGLTSLVGEHIYSYEEDTLEHALGVLLKATGKTLSAAESCTGGEISHLITTVPGSSEYYLGSVTSYAIPVKEKVLGVDPRLIEQNGVVSSEVAAAMAEGVRRLTGSDFSVATTGFAGPGGGDERYPEGTVWVGVSSEKGTETRKFEYHNDRKRNIQRFSASALFFLFTKVRTEVNY